MSESVSKSGLYSHTNLLSKFLTQVQAAQQSQKRSSSQVVIRDVKKSQGIRIQQIISGGQSIAMENDLQQENSIKQNLSSKVMNQQGIQKSHEMVGDESFSTQENLISISPKLFLKPQISEIFQLKKTKVVHPKIQQAAQHVNQKLQLLEQLDQECNDDYYFYRQQKYGDGSSSILETEPTSLNTTRNIYASPSKKTNKSSNLPYHLKNQGTLIMITGLEDAPFLQQFKGQNAVHEGDREKATSITANLVYRPAEELGKFKYIFSNRLRDKYFHKLDKAKLNLKKETKLELGQISHNEISDSIRRQGYLKIIDLLWDKIQLRNISGTTLLADPDGSMIDYVEPFKYQSKEEFSTSLIDLMEAEHNDDYKQQLAEEQAKSKMIERARKQIMKQNNEELAINELQKNFKQKFVQMLFRKQKQPTSSEENKERVKKAFTVQKMVDPCIQFAQGGENQAELMNFYFDKFNFHKKDLSPFINEKAGDSDYGKTRYTQAEKNLSRRFHSNRRSVKKIEKYNASINEHKKSIESLMNSASESSNNKGRRRGMKSTIESMRTKNNGESPEAINSKMEGEDDQVYGIQPASLGIGQESQDQIVNSESQSVPFYKDEVLNSCSAISGQPSFNLFPSISPEKKEKFVSHPQSRHHIRSQSMQDSHPVQNKPSSINMHQDAVDSPDRYQAAEFKQRFYDFRERLTKDFNRKKLPQVDLKAQRLIHRLKESLQSQREMKKHLDLFDSPKHNNEKYFEKKIQNFYEAQKMENSVKNYVIEDIINGGMISNKKRKRESK